jgi:hypothetical protein
VKLPLQFIQKIPLIFGWFMGAHAIHWYFRLRMLTSVSTENTFDIWLFMGAHVMHLYFGFKTLASKLVNSSPIHILFLFLVRKSCFCIWVGIFVVTDLDIHDMITWLLIRVQDKGTHTRVNSRRPGISGLHICVSKFRCLLSTVLGFLRFSHL